MSLADTKKITCHMHLTIETKSAISEAHLNHCIDISSKASEYIVHFLFYMAGCSSVPGIPQAAQRPPYFKD